MKVRVSFKNSKGQRLAGILNRGKKKRSKAIICLHGYTGRKEGTALRVAHALKGNFDTLHFDFTGNNESEGELSEGTFSQEVRDVKSALAFLQKKGYREFGVVGHSMGGVIAILAANNPRIKAVASFGAPASVKEMERRVLDSKHRRILREKGAVEVHLPGWDIYTIRQSFFRDALQYDVLAYARRIRKPFLVMHGSEDSLVPAEHAKLIARASPTAQLVIVRRGDHWCEAVQTERAAMKALKEFFVKVLK